MIDAKPETEAMLRNLAESRGQSLDELLRSLLVGVADGAISNLVPVEKHGPAERLAAFRSWIAEHSSPGPVLSDEAIARESIYED